MRIPCPFCGERPVDEFSTIGTADWVEYVYVRANPAGPHREWFHHVGGCRAWLEVTRDTRTHELIAVRAADGTARP
jgi:sarcosine oxidase subunit delta